MFRQDEFNSFLIEKDVVGFFPEGRALKSGRFSFWYANCRNLLDTVGAADRTASFLISFLNENSLECDYLYGVPAGVTKLADIANYKRGIEGRNPAHPLVIGRESPKGHGDPKDRYFVGPVKKGDRVIMVEDVTTTGGSMLTALDQLLEVGVNVVGVVALVNRSERRDDGKSVADCVAEKGSKYYSMSDAAQLIPMAISKYRPGNGFLAKFQENFNEFAITPIKVV